MCSTASVDAKKKAKTERRKSREVEDPVDEEEEYDDVYDETYSGTLSGTLSTRSSLQSSEISFLPSPKMSALKTNRKAANNKKKLLERQDSDHSLSWCCMRVCRAGRKVNCRHQQLGCQMAKYKHGHALVEISI
jgi:hypothetical protein